MVVKRDKMILLTFDVEEFDLPQEYKIPINAEEQMFIGKQGMDIIENILDKHKINCTLFITGAYANNFSASVKQLSTKHEIASHSLHHSSFQQSDLLESRLLLQKISGQDVNGFRMPRMKKIPISWVKDGGYNYDSSINPTIMPGRYNNFHLPRTVYKEHEVIRLPGSVTPNFRIPLFWLSFKNFPYSFYKKIALQTLKRDGYLSLYFHPWEFTDLSHFKLPNYIKNPSGNILADKLENLINFLKNEADFCTINSFIEKRTINNYL